jgi:hypothetical protein
MYAGLNPAKSYSIYRRTIKLAEKEIYRRKHYMQIRAKEKGKNSLVIELTEHGNTAHYPMGLRLIRGNAHVHNEIS